jgi:uncharacterized protein HemX
MNDNSQNTRAVVTILGILACVLLVVCSGVGLIGYTFVTRYNQAQKVEAEAELRQAEAAQQAPILSEQPMPQ